MRIPFLSQPSLRKLFSFLAIFSLIFSTLYFGKSKTLAVSPINDLTMTPASLEQGAHTTYTISFTAPFNLTAEPPSFMNIWVQGNGPWEEGYLVDFSEAVSDFGEIEIPEEGNPGSIGIRFTTPVATGNPVTIHLSNVGNPTAFGSYYAHAQVTAQEGQQAEGESDPFFIGQVKVQGRVVDPNDEGVAWVGLGLHNENKMYQSNTDDNGDFAFFETPAGNYKLEVWLGPDSEYIAPDPVDVTVGSGVTNVGEIALVSPSKQVKGRVIYPDGRPVTTAQINANRRGAPGWYGANTDSNGNYTLRLPGGEFEMMVMPQWEQNGQLPVDWAYMGKPRMVSFENNNTPEIKTGYNFQVVEASATVAGKIVDPANNPVTQGGVDVRNNEGQGSSGGLNNKGIFSLNVPPGKYKINVFVNNQSLAVPSFDPFTVADDETKNLGTIQLEEKNSHLKGKVSDEDGNGIAGVDINAWQPEMGGGWGHAQTNAQGMYDLLVMPGTWQLDAMPSPDMDYARAGGPPTEVTIEEEETVGGINFELITADATISGQVVDDNNEVIGDLYGYADARPGNKGEMPIGGMGGPIQNGLFTIKVPAGTYEVNAMFEPGSPYTSVGSKSVTVATGQTKTVKVTVRQNNASITGFILDEDGNEITGQRAEVFGFNEDNSQKMTMVDPETGAYTLGVLGGSTWYLGVFIEPDSGYVMVPPDDNKVEVEVGDELTRNFTLLTADAKISGTVLDPEGDPLSNVFVFVDSKAVDDGTVLGASDVRNPEGSGGPGEVLGVEDDHKGAPGDPKDEGPGVHFGDMVNPDGTFEISVPAGTYGVGSGAPSSLGYISPEIQKVTVEKDKEVSGVTLRYKKSDAKIQGSVYLDGEKSPAFVWAWSESGGFSGNFTVNGDFSLNVTKGDVWHIGADYESGQNFYRSDEYIVEVDAAVESQDLTMQEASFTMPSSISQTFDASAPQVITLEDGMTISIPAGAIATEGNITVTVTPTAQLAKQKNKKPLAFGYEIKAYNASGQEITTNFNSSVTIVIPYTEEMLEELGITEDDLSSAYWDETSNLWQDISGFVVDTENNRITITVDHFTSFALVTGESDTIPPAAPSSVSVTDPGTGGELTIAWTNPADSDFASIKIYRSTVSGTLGDVVASVTDGSTTYTDNGLTNGTAYYYTLHSLDTKGNESYNTDQYSDTPSGETTEEDTDEETTELPETGMSYYVVRSWFVKVWNFIGVTF